METFQFAMKIVSGGLTLYIVLITFSILLSWFQGPSFGRPLEILRSITDPYLDWFRRFHFLRIGNFDFSVILAIMVLLVIANITDSIGTGAAVTFGAVLALIIGTIGSAVRFMLIFFLIMAVIRVVGGALRVETTGTLLINLDRLLEPIVHKIVLTLSQGKFVSYRNQLLIFSGLTAVAIFAVRLLIESLVRLMVQLPI